jgi:hypothetical protein
MSEVYLMASLRNEKTPAVANKIEVMTGITVFDSWFSPGPEADDFWRNYEKARGRSYEQALDGYAATHIYEFDKYHIDRCDIGVLLQPAGKSCHLELGYMLGQGKLGYIVFEEEPERWDVMYQFATGIFFSLDELVKELNETKIIAPPPPIVNIGCPCKCSDHIECPHCCPLAGRLTNG